MEIRWCTLETNNDITQQQRIEKALRESEERFRAIVETTPECVKLVSADGTLFGYEFTRFGDGRCSFQR